MMGHMFGYGYGNTINWWWMLGFGLLRILVVVVVIIFIVKIFKNNDKLHSSSKAIEILRERYTSGEIDENEYKRKLKILK